MLSLKSSVNTGESLPSRTACVWFFLPPGLKIEKEDFQAEERKTF